MGHELDSTLANFPSYAELSQTQAWRSGAPRVKADTNEAAEAAEVSHASRYTEGAVLGTGGMGKSCSHAMRGSADGRSVGSRRCCRATCARPHEPVAHDGWSVVHNQGVDVSFGRSSRCHVGL
jgi:hypothetical protein